MVRNKRSSQHFVAARSKPHATQANATFSPPGRDWSRQTAMLIVACGLLLLIGLTACSSPPAAPEESTDDRAAGDRSDAESAAQNAAVTDADNYQAQRANCTWETPCWPEVSTTIPASFQEAPTLAERVAAGELPPVEERLPSQPLVLEPAEMIGQYGGVIRRGFTGPGDRPNVWRWNNDHTIFWNTGANELRPRLAHSWEANADATTWTFHLRPGMRWSDGAPFGADDYLFWYTNILTNETLVPTPPWYMQWGDELAVFEKVDDQTFTIHFAAPFPGWPDYMASGLIAGNFRFGRVGGGLFAPRHYLEQFHADFVGEERANELANAAGFENWSLHFLAKNDAYTNMDLPVVTPWKPVTPISSNEFVLERNPYFYGVDSAGNQLPYVDGIALELVEELEVLNLRAIAGNYTVQGRHIDFSKLPVFRENEAAGNYFVDFWNSSTRHPVQIAFNQDWNADPAIAAYTVGSLDFRRALALAIERSEINETFFLGVGREASFCPQNTPPYFTNSRWDEQFGQFDPETANQLLDEIGLAERDAEGFRRLPNGDRLVLRIDAVSGAFLDYPGIAERIAQMWEQQVGIQLLVNPVERSLWVERTEANQPMMSMFETGEFAPATASSLIPDIRWAPLANAWGSVPNPDPADYEGPGWIKDQVAKHWAAVQEPDADERLALFIEGTEILCDNQPRLGILVDVPVYTTVIKNNVRNVAKPMEWAVVSQTPGNGYPEQFFLLQE